MRQSLILGTAFVCSTIFIITSCATHLRVTRTALSESTPETDLKKIIVARVNGIPLSMESLVKMMNRIRSRNISGKPESLEEHRKRSLDRLVLQELAYQKAKAAGASVDPAKIDTAIKNFKENVGGAEGFVKYLSEQNMTEAELRAQIDRSLTLELMYAREVLNKVTVPEDELRREYEKVKHQYVTPENASMIDVHILEKDIMTAKKKGKQLLDRINANAARDPWKLTLDGTFIVRSMTVSKENDRELFQASKMLKPDQLSKIIQTATGSHIIKLKSYWPERQLTFDEVKSKIEMQFRVPAQEKRLLEWEQELKQNARIEILEPATFGSGS